MLMKFSFSYFRSYLYNPALFHFSENTTMRMTGIMVLLLLALLLQSCGHKGPLFLPPAQPSIQPLPDQNKKL
jgi:predicted small lipoprotein YifL